MIWMLALLGCGDKDVDDTGGSVEDSGITDSGITDSGTTDSGATDSGTTDGGGADSGGTDSGDTDGGGDSGATGGDTGTVDPGAALRPEEVRVDLRLYTPPEGPWEVDVELYGDGVFADRVARVEVTITPESSLTATELALVPGGSTDLFVSASRVEVAEEGMELEPLVVEGESYPLKADPEVLDVEYEEVEDAVLPMLGTWALPEAYNSPVVYGAIDSGSGQLLLRTVSAGDGDHYPVGAFRLADGEALDMVTQTSSWRSGDDAPTGELARDTLIGVKFEVYDDKDELAGSAESTAMYGDIIMGGVALDDFND